VDVDVIVFANMIVAALGAGNDIVDVIDLAWTRGSRALRMLDPSALRVESCARSIYRLRSADLRLRH
jgi:hypothetical protein